MTGQRVFWIVVAVLIGAAAAWGRNWWTSAAMVCVVIGQLTEAWKARSRQAGRADPVGGRDIGEPRADS